MKKFDTTSGKTPADPGSVFSVASYNVHRCIGCDRKRDPDRIAEVIRELDAPIVGLQEVDARFVPGRAADQAEYLSRLTGLEAISGPTIHREDGRYGNALLTSARVLNVRRHDLSISGREPRGAVDADIEIAGIRVRCLVTHLGLRVAERRHQTRRLIEILSGAGDVRDQPTILLGDFNAWVAWAAPLRRLRERFGRRASPRSFPVWAPLLRLDRIWVDPPSALLEVKSHRSPLARTASDHFPVRGTVDFG